MDAWSANLCTSVRCNMNPVAAAPSKRTTKYSCIQEETIFMVSPMQLSELGRSTTRYCKCSKAMYVTKEDAIRHALRFWVSV